MSIVVGTNACNAKCPFCISRITGQDISLPIVPNWRNFNKACILADKAGATTILLTGKGEPTLYPELITEYLIHIKDNGNFPFIELQTNGIVLKDINDFIKEWYRLGLTTISLSAVETGFANKKIYGANYPSIETTVALIHGADVTVRLSIMMLKKYICTPDDIDRVVDFCKVNKIKQLTIRAIDAPINPDCETAKWVIEHTLTKDQIKAIESRVKEVGVPVLHLAHGAVVYDYKGQNLCLGTCLTTNNTDENMRQIIFYPDGTISYDWKYKGAILL